MMTDLLSKETIEILVCVNTIAYFVMGLIHDVCKYRAKKEWGKGIMLMITSPLLAFLTIPVLAIVLMVACVVVLSFVLVFIVSKLVDLFGYLWGKQ